jgi:hypothetical protein
VNLLTAISYLRTLALCLLIAGSTEAQTLSGSWCGVGEQTNPDGSKSHWTARMHLAGQHGRMDYPSLDCGGTLTFVRAEGLIHFYRERITYGRDRCVDGGLVAVEPVEASVRWNWKGSGIRASAVLAPGCREKPSVRLNETRRRPS